MIESTSAIPPLKSSLSDLEKPESFLLIGPPGAGKTTQIWTMPSPRLAIYFDPNGAAATRGAPDTQYLEFLNEGGGVSSVGGDMRKIEAAAFVSGKAPKANIIPPTAYTRFQAFWNEAIRVGFFDQFVGGTVMVDSYTTFEEAILDEFMYSRGKESEAKEEQGDARRKALKQVGSIVGGLTSKGIVTVFTAHRRDKTDRGGATIGFDIEAIGRARQALPSKFSNILYLSTKPGEGKGKRKYIAQTSPGGFVDWARVPDHDAPFELDITVGDWNNPSEYGLGKYLSDLRAKIEKLKESA